MIRIPLNRSAEWESGQAEESNDSASHGTAWQLTRRGFVERCLLSAVACRIAGCASVPGGTRLDRFIGLCGELTGVPASALDPIMAERLMQAFAAAGRGAELARLLAGTAASEDDGLSRDLVVAWYSGIHPAQPGDSGEDSTFVRTEVVGTYEEALIWRALDFARPQGICAGAPGHWSQPPSA